jgi:hypothetical protein
MEAESLRNMSLRITHRIHDEQTVMLLDHSSARRFRTTTHHCKLWRSAEDHVRIPSLQDHRLHRRITRKHRLWLPSTTS